MIQHHARHPLSVRSASLRRRSAGLAAGLGLALLLSACATQHGVSLRKNDAPLMALDGASDLLPTPAISQVLSPLDQVRVQILPVATTPGGLALEPYDTIKYEFSFRGSDYHILPGDELSVHFGSDPKRDLSLIVRPDGKVTLPDAGEVTALGKTPAQLADDIDAAYSNQMKVPGAAVSLTKAGLSPDDLSGEAVVQDDGTVAIPKIGRVAAAGLTVAQLSSSLSELASKHFETSLAAQISRQIPSVDKQKEGLVGFDQLLPVSADGRLALPELGTFAAAGKTIAFMQNEIQDALRSRYKSDLTVSMEIEQSQARVIYVDGEVGHAGAYPLAPDMTMLKALTLAGGIVNTGDMRRVILIHRDAKDDVYVYTTNLKDFIENGARANDLALSSQDIVVVPKTAVAKVDQWVDQYITGVLPFSRSASYSYTQGTVKPTSP
ncbi:MAG TPA: polysaccharide biosynthesis/export family protein [Opitutaceae bacterium]|nr:polysaccharide biosynthesis/export family protein [Opitutaceae bacterium]